MERIIFFERAKPRKGVFMAKIIIAGDAMIIESAYTLDDIATLKKYRPKALTLFDNDGKSEVFKVGLTCGTGSISNYGASFGSSSKNEAGRAIITVMIPSCVEDAKAYAEEVVGAAIIKLNMVEDQFGEALADVAAERQEVRENITIL